MKTVLMLPVMVLLAKLTSYAQSTNELFKMRGTVVGTGTVAGITFANPHSHVRIEPPDLSMTVRVDSTTPLLPGYTNGAFVTFSSRAQSNFFPRHTIRGATYDFVIARRVGTSASEQLEFKAPPKLVGQPGGPANRSQPVRSETNSTSPAAGSGR